MSPHFSHHGKGWGYLRKMRKLYLLYLLRCVSVISRLCFYRHSPINFGWCGTSALFADHVAAILSSREVWRLSLTNAETLSPIFAPMCFCEFQAVFLQVFAYKFQLVWNFGGFCRWFRRNFVITGSLEDIFEKCGFFIANICCDVFLSFPGNVFTGIRL